MCNHRFFLIVASIFSTGGATLHFAALNLGFCSLARCRVARSRSSCSWRVFPHTRISSISVSTPSRSSNIWYILLWKTSCALRIPNGMRVKRNRPNGACMKYGELRIVLIQGDLPIPRPVVQGGKEPSTCHSCSNLFYSGQLIMFSFQSLVSEVFGVNTYRRRLPSFFLTITIEFTQSVGPSTLSTTPCFVESLLQLIS